MFSIVCLLSALLYLIDLYQDRLPFKLQLSSSAEETRSGGAGGGGGGGFAPFR